MTRTKRILLIVAAVFGIAVTALAVAVSYDAPCSDVAAVSNPADSMRVVQARCYGPPEILRIAEIPKPQIQETQVLVKVHAAAVNPLDWHLMRGEPYMMRLVAGIGAPKDARVGVDFSGTVVAVGQKVTRFKVGDEVFGGADGALGQFVVVGEAGSIVHKPSNISFKQAAGVAVAAITALQAIRDKGKLQAGQRVLVNGASGGVGTFAVQIAKALDTEVTGVCSTRNVALVRSLGADHVVDYTQANFTESDARYDVIVDTVGNHSLRALRKVLKAEGAIVMLGGSSEDPWLGAMWQPIKAAMLSPFVDERIEFLLADLNQTDLAHLSELLRDGKVTPVVDREYPFEQSAEAIAYLERGRARGKVIVNMP